MFELLKEVKTQLSFVKCLQAGQLLVIHNLYYGYCLLLSDPVVADLNDLKGSQRTQYLNDMALIGDALLSVTDAFRINYEILGNYDPALHCHIFPRYTSEPEEQRQAPIWLSYSSEERSSRPFDLKRDKKFIEQVANYIQKQL